MAGPVVAEREKAGVSPPRNLGRFLDTLRRAGELADVHAEVDPELEVTEIYDRVVKRGGPALLFHRVKGSPYPLAINLFGSFKRLALAFGGQALEEVAARVEDFTKLPPTPVTLLDKLKLLPRLGALSHITPRLVGQGPCQEVVESDGPLLSSLPVLKCWPQDAGRFITYPLVITRDPEDGTRNVGLYRMQVYDERTTGMHWQVHKDGAEHFRAAKRKGIRRLDVAAALGCDPVTLYAASAPLPKGFDEFMLAGFLRSGPLALVRAKTVDLEVPAEAEFVLEGYVDTDEMRLEGPFGDHTGFYSLAKEFPVFHVTCLTHRRKPVYYTTVVGRPPMEDCYLGRATERIFLPMIRKHLPEIVDIHMPWEGVFHNCLLVKIRKSYPDHAKKVMHAIWGFGQMMFAKCIVVFDEEANIQDVREAAWRAFNNVDPKRDIVFTEGPVDELDISASNHLYGSKMGIDATRKGADEGMNRPWPDEMLMSGEVKERVSARWSEYGLAEGSPVL